MAGAGSDVIIVGAGLAGLSAAREIAARSRARVLVVERHGIGSNNPTPMTFADVPARYGLQGCTIGEYRRFTFHSTLGSRSTHTYQETSLVALDYQPACQVLLAEAQASGDVECLQATAGTLRRQGDRWQVELGGGRKISAPLVIDASGRGLYTSHKLGLPSPRSYSHCYGARLANACVPDPQEAFFFTPSAAYGDGGGWLYPLDGGRASVGFATLSNDPTLPGGLVKGNFQRALADFEPFASWLREAVVEHVEVGSIPIYPLRRLVYDGLLIAGDAAGQATIWSCMGSEAALEAGRLAGTAAVSALQKGDFSAQALRSYQEAWDASHRRTYRNNALIAPVVWSMPEAEWDRQIRAVQALEPVQMLARLRVNWPVPSLPQALFVRVYDMAGRLRRGLARRLRPYRLVSSRS